MRVAHATNGMAASMVLLERGGKEKAHGGWRDKLKGDKELAVGGGIL